MRAEDKTDELKQLNRSIFRPVITFNKDAKRAAQESKIQERYEEEREEREKAMLDIRQTLPNLKYLLYVATAGEGELPARKAGGVRGLLRGARPELERSGSMDSNSSRLSGLTLSSMGFRNPNGTGNGKAKSAADRLREFDVQR